MGRYRGSVNVMYTTSVGYPTEVVYVLSIISIPYHCGTNAQLKENFYDNVW